MALTCGLGLRAQTDGARLSVRTVTGASTCRIGERISVELAFTAPPRAELALVMAIYDRSGRMSFETFEVNPATGSRDPLAAYFNGGSSMGGAMASPSVLSDKPVTMRLGMNERVRFDQPGDYTVTIPSARVIPAGKPLFAGPEHFIPSHPLRLHIIPVTPEWQHAKLAAALPLLAAKPALFGPLSPEAVGSIADVRFLGSAESIAVLAAGLGDDQRDRNSAFAFGLIGLPTPLHELARRTLRERLEDPQTAVSSGVCRRLLC